MLPLTQNDLFSLEHYARIRDEFRARVMAHKKKRRLPIGPHATLYFEDRLTMHYQVQEMLRAEQIFEVLAVQEELDAYNPLIPDGRNWKATLMIEHEDADAHRDALARLKGIEDKVWAQVSGHDRVWPIANEDLDRNSEGSSVHFLRFELTSEMITDVKGGAAVTFGIAHPEYNHHTDVPTSVREALAADLS